MWIESGCPMEMREPLVSIIMPVFNCESTVGAAVESIINQTYSNWQLIVCDDCSTDNSFSILEGYREQLGTKMILLRNENNSKIAATLNRCLEYATGKYVARMDADDRCKPRRIQVQVEFLESHQEYECVGSGREIFDDKGKKGIRISREYPTEIELFKSTPFAHPTIMMRKSAYDTLGGYRIAEETLRAEDVDLWFRFWAAGFRGYNLQEILLEYRESANDFNKRTLKAAVGTTKVYLKYWKEQHFQLRFLPLCYKPILVAIFPRRIMYYYHKRKDGSNG